MDVPGWVLTATIWSYWIGVGAMIVRVRRHTRKVVGVVPEQRLERFMWLVWVPLVAAWCTLPWLALHRTDAPWALPAFARGAEVYAALRWLAAAVAVACLAATVKCWARMGKDWRMAVTAEKEGVLITDGMFSRMRHPIYAFSILLMLATMVIVPTVPMLAFGVGPRAADDREGAQRGAPHAGAARRRLRALSRRHRPLLPAFPLKDG